MNLSGEAELYIWSWFHSFELETMHCNILYILFKMTKGREVDSRMVFAEDGGREVNGVVVLQEKVLVMLEDAF